MQVRIHGARFCTCSPSVLSGFHGQPSFPTRNNPFLARFYAFKGSSPKKQATAIHQYKKTAKDTAEYSKNAMTNKRNMQPKHQKGKKVEKSADLVNWLQKISAQHGPQGAKKGGGGGGGGGNKAIKDHIRTVVIEDSQRIDLLNKQLKAPTALLLELLLEITGEPHQIHQIIDADTAELLVRELHMTPVRGGVDDRYILEPRAPPTDEERATWPPRRPIVTIMGHVDHGKTSLLDRLRSSSIVAGEAGGITQHVGAFTVSVPDPSNKKNEIPITLIDTPGHKAFTEMRRRGAEATDIVILVVAATEGVKPQTIEAINYATSHNVPLVVAINKIDLEAADPAKTRQSLLESGVVLEEFGGDVPSVEISALKGINLDMLLETVLLQAELLELKGDPSGEPECVLVESSVVKGRGMSTALIVMRGTLKNGHALVAGQVYAKVRGMCDDQGKSLREATPGMTCRVFGWKDLPNAGELALGTATEQKAAAVAEYRLKESLLRHEQTSELSTSTMGAGIEAHTGSLSPTSSSLHASSAADRLSRDENYDPVTGMPLGIKQRTVDVVLKSDVFGTLEALRQQILMCQNEYVKTHIILAGVGEPTSADLARAGQSEGLVIAFGVDTPPSFLSEAREKGVSVLSSNIIYRLTEGLVAELGKVMPKRRVEQQTGRATVKALFPISGKTARTAAGCAVNVGSLNADHFFKVERGGQMLFKGRASCLRRHKDIVHKVDTGLECGLELAGFTDIQPGDIISCITYSEEPVPFLFGSASSE